MFAHGTARFRSRFGLLGGLVLGLLWLAMGCHPARVISPDAPLSTPSPNTSRYRPSATLTATPTYTPTPTRPKPSPTPSPTPSATTPPDITLLFTGNIVPARCVQAATEARGDNPDYLYAQVADRIRAADVAIGVLNAALSDYPPMTGCRPTFVLVGRSYHADALARAGFDVINVATNHIKNCGLLDCGDRAFLDTLRNLRQAGLQVVGAGETLDQALEPLVLTVKGVRIALVALGYIEPRAYAGPDTPGIGVLTEANLHEAMARARATHPDIIIAMPHWGPEYDPQPDYLQRHFARLWVQAGADVVVGNHAHVVQGVELIEHVPVFYSLGNFMFDQDWSEATQQGVILELRLRGSRVWGWRFWPTVTEGDGTVRWANEAEAQAILQRMRAVSRPRQLVPLTPGQWVVLGESDDAIR
ncbi:MAG: CapA family protein [Chloroflexi bacterium]|nr:CapA family protein [Chloroflexota bacterium]